MPRLTWGSTGTRYFETGIDRGVLYVGKKAGVAWNGLTGVDESPSGGETEAYYIDGVKYLQTSASEEYAATISAFSSPVEFDECDGTLQPRPGLFLNQQRRKTFSLSYRTMIGNDVSAEHGYKLHIVYNALAEPSQRSYETAGENVEPSDLSWSITTKPPVLDGYRRTAHITIDSRYTDPRVLSDIEDVLYGTDEFLARIPDFEELIVLFDAYLQFEVVDNGDGTATIVGPETAVQYLEPTLAQLTWETVVPIDEDTYSVSSG